jgi:hypothetical protein
MIGYNDLNKHEDKGVWITYLEEPTQNSNDSGSAEINDYFKMSFQSN